MRLSRIVYTIILAALGLFSPGYANSPAIVVPVSLEELRLPDVRIGSVEYFPGGSGEITVPYRRVEGVIGTEIGFEVLLPDDWNGRFFMGGGSGFVGSIINTARGEVNRGFASAGTDTGHRGSPVDGEWAMENVERRLNFGYLAVHRTAEVAKAIIREYYGRDPEFSYFSGASRGGGQALMEAQRYPGDFDGIIAGCPAQEWSGFMAKMVQNVRLNYPDPNDVTKHVITQENLRLLESEILAACDELDGVRDGVLEDPRLCDFDLESIPLCPEEVSAADCLTTAQRAAIGAIYADVIIDGEVVYPGQPFGNEGDPRGWNMWITGTRESGGTMEPSFAFEFGTEFYKYFIFDDPDWDYSTYDFSTWEEDTRLAATYLDAVSPDLSAFAERGGKLIMWHGWSDPALPAERSVEYYEEVRAHDPGCDEYLRLYLLPGVLHGRGGSGPDRVDWEQIIVDWVEHGNAPEAVPAKKLDAEGNVVRTRPLCPYPAKAVYTGSGSTDEWGSFECE